jgi:hypothetical protein
MKTLLVICLIIMALAFIPTFTGYILGGIMFCLAWLIAHWFITIPVLVLVWLLK